MTKRKRVLLALGCYQHQVHEGVARFARQADWQLTSTCEQQDMLPSHWQGDGLIVNQWDHQRIRDALRDHSLPIVSMCQRAFPEHVAVVIQDNYRIGQLAAEHLLERQFESFLAVSLEDKPSEQQRIAGFLEGIAQSNHPCRELSMWQREPEQPGGDPWQRLGQELVDSHRPLGVFCPSDYLGAEVIEVCHRRELAVPEQVAVVGAGNHELIAENAAIALSSVDGNYEQWGYEAARQLDQLLRHHPVPSEPIRVEPGSVVKRTSSDILAISHLGVARAVRYIWENFQDPIDVADVVEAISPMTRRGLEKAFRRHLNRSPAQEILRKRLDRAKHLILENQHKSYEIAKMCGFRDAEHLREIFHRHLGMAPRAFRKMHEKQTVG